MSKRKPRTLRQRVTHLRAPEPQPDGLPLALDTAEGLDAHVRHRRLQDLRGMLIPYLTEPVIGPGRRSQLREIIEFDPDAYAKMIQMIRDGAFDHVAAGVLGVPKNTFSRWMSRGREEAERFLEAETAEERESCLSEYCKLWNDVNVARSVCRARVELELRRTNPEFWIAKGPSRDDWGDGRQQVDINVSGAIEHDHLNICPATAETLAAALQELAEHTGLIAPTARLEDMVTAERQRRGTSAADETTEDDVIDVEISPPEESGSDGTPKWK